MVHPVEYPLGDSRRVVVRPAANLAIEPYHQVGREALPVLANFAREVAQVALLCRRTGFDEGFEAQRFAYGVSPGMGFAHPELPHRASEEVKPCQLSSVGPQGMHDPRLAGFPLPPHVCQPASGYIPRTLDV